MVRISKEEEKANKQSTIFALLVIIVFVLYMFYKEVKEGIRRKRKEKLDNYIMGRRFITTIHSRNNTYTGKFLVNFRKPPNYEIYQLELNSPKETIKLKIIYDWDNNFYKSFHEDGNRTIIKMIDDNLFYLQYENYQLIEVSFMNPISKT